jgi:hypothetical protein
VSGGTSKTILGTYLLQIIAMAAAVAGPLLSAELSALVGLGTFAEARKEEVFAPFCGKWIKVSCQFKQTDQAVKACSM